MAQLAWVEVFAVVEPLVVPADADHPLVLATGVVVTEVASAVVVDEVVGAGAVGATGAAAALAIAAVVLVAAAEVAVAAIQAPRLTVATTLTTAAAMRDRWAARRRGRWRAVGSLIMGVMIRDARKTAANPM